MTGGERERECVEKRRKIRMKEGIRGGHWGRGLEMRAMWSLIAQGAPLPRPLFVVFNGICWAMRRDTSLPVITPSPYSTLPSLYCSSPLILLQLPTPIPPQASMLSHSPTTYPLNPLFSPPSPPPYILPVPLQPVCLHTPISLCKLEREGGNFLLLNESTGELRLGEVILSSINKQDSLWIINYK